MKLAKIAVLSDRKAVERRRKYGLNAFGLYAEEVLSHAGFAYDVLHDVAEVETSGHDAVIVAACGEDETASSALTAYMEKGGIVIGCAGLNKLAGKLGYAKEEPVGPGYAFLPQSGGDGHPLRFLEAVPWRAVSPNAPASEHGTIRRERPDGTRIGPALQTFRIGKGRLYRWTVDIWHTIVGMQQGTGPVMEDGVPAPDGTGAVDDGILKADDRVAMDWKYDRLATETGKPYFAYPYADLWRETFVRTMLEAILERGKTLPFIGYYPAGVSHVAMISHDSDHNLDEHAETTLALLAECGVYSTWCMLEPGYGKPIYEKVKAAGHEIAFHYNALEMQNGAWSEDEFGRQLAWLKQAADVGEVTSNKNHYTRFEGWGELFAWCEKHGIASDQTRGPSKKGNVGLLFGTCHPYFPIAWADEGNRFYDVLEIGFLTQDLELPNLSDNSVIRPFLEQVKRVSGVAHFLYHQTHLHNREEVRDSLRTLVREARQMGFDFWTGKKVNDWERYRRKLKATLSEDGNVRVEGPASAYPIVVYVPIDDRQAASEADSAERRFGVACRRHEVRIESGDEVCCGKIKTF